MSDIEPAATVAICTRNRAASLARTLDSIVAAARDVDRPWELLIVDNGSQDDTPAVVERFADRLPIRRIAEPVPGLSNARNAGIVAARGGYIIWTDDDVLVDEAWLAAYLDAFARFPADAVFGGTAVPRYEEPSSRWFVAAARDLESLLAIRNHREWERIETDRVPYGLNFAIRIAEQRAHRFDPELGVAPGRRRGGEETAVIRAILREGGTGRWVWDARVFHLIPAARQTVGYVHQYYRSHGYDFPAIPLDARGPRIAGVPLRLGLTAAKAAALLAARRLAGGRWARSLRDLARVHGTLDRFRAEHRRG